MEARRLPSWLRTKPPRASAVAGIRGVTSAKGLTTVCREARCPNRGECFQQGTATFLILGDRCTRDCGFCAVRHGHPEPVRTDEPKLVADSVASLGLKHAVITSVTRDDLPDGGAFHFAETVPTIRAKSPGTRVEVLVPDYGGSYEALATVTAAGPDLLGHNMETVPRLYSALRRGASYDRSLRLLLRVRELDPGIITKSGIMVGVGESREEVLRVVGDLVDVGCAVLTIGQYLRPTRKNHPVARFLHPEEFAELRMLALSAGMGHVASGPLVRSSYRACEIFEQLGRGPRPSRRS